MGPLLRPKMMTSNTTWFHHGIPKFPRNSLVVWNCGKSSEPRPIIFSFQALIFWGFLSVPPQDHPRFPATPSNATRSAATSASPGWPFTMGASSCSKSFNKICMYDLNSEIFRDPVKVTWEKMGPIFPYHSHFRIPKDMGMVWVLLTGRRFHVLGSPWNHP